MVFESEKELEIMLCENSESSIIQNISLFKSCIERQYKLESGKRIDILSFHINESDEIDANIIELKNVTATASAIIQCCQYVLELSLIGNGESKFTPIIIAPSFSFDAICLYEFMPRLRLIMFSIGLDGLRLEEVPRSPSPYNILMGNL